MACVNDPLLGAGKVCENPCASIDECSNLSTTCQSEICTLNACGPGTGNGAYNSFCNVIGTNDGTCTPLQIDGGEVGICSQGGSATNACNPSADRDELSTDCVAGEVCVGGGIGSGGFCGDACDPNGPNTCPAGQSCAFTIDDEVSGACVPF